jgi:hypothetical protein
MADSCERGNEPSSSEKGAEFLTEHLLASHDELSCMELLKTPFILSIINCKDTGKVIPVLKRHIMKVYRELEAQLHSFLTHMEMIGHLRTPAA